MTEQLLPVADFFSAQVRRMTRCSVRGHDWQPVEGGQACTRCPMQIRTDTHDKGGR